MVIVAEDIEHVGCVTVTVGVVGVTGAALMIAAVVGEIHPVVFLTVTEYVPVDKFVNMPVVLE